MGYAPAMKKNTTVAARQDAHVKYSRWWFIFAGVNQWKIKCPASSRRHRQKLIISLVKFVVQVVVGAAR